VLSCCAAIVLSTLAVLAAPLALAAPTPTQLRVLMVQPLSSSINTTADTLAAHMALVNQSMINGQEAAVDVIIFPEGFLQVSAPLRGVRDAVVASSPVCDAPAVFGPHS
jgi:hypothetical protein